MREPKAEGDLTAGDSCGEGGPGSADGRGDDGRDYGLADLTPRSHLRWSRIAFSPTNRDAGRVFAVRDASTRWAGAKA